MIIYLAGKISGTGARYKHVFQEAHVALLNADHKVLNPATLPDDLPPTAYMPICLSMLQQADAICMVGDDWQNSQGASIELAYASYQGKRIFKSVQEVLHHDGTAQMEERPGIRGDLSGERPGTCAPGENR